MDFKNLIKGRGLKFHDSVPKEVKEDGKMVTKYIPTERPLREDDILSHRVRGDVVTIVTKDGQRYKIDTTLPPGQNALRAGSRASRLSEKPKPEKSKGGKEDKLHPREEILVGKGMKATKKGYSYKSMFIHKEELLAMSDDKFQTFIDDLVKKQDDK